MNLPKFLSLLIAATLFFGLAPSVGIAGSGTEAKIESRLVETLTRDGTANFIVEMSAHADLSAAYGLSDSRARGQFVFDTLREFAQKSQAKVLTYAQQHGLRATSFLAANAVYIQGGELKDAVELAAIPGVGIVREERIVVGSAKSSNLAARAGDFTLPTTIEWNIQDTLADQLWTTYDIRGAGSKVALIDTGVQWNHPALINQFACPGAPTDPKCWKDPANICGAGGACDNNGHGTHLMGIMVGDDGGVNQIGMAPEAQWIACKGCESFSCSESSLGACADWILAPGGDPANRPDVVYNGWGGMGGDTWFQPQVNAWRAAGIAPVFAAGGSGPGCGTLGSPADYQQVFTSAAHDANRVNAPFSSRGPSLFGHDPYTKPNSSTPGVNIRSAYLTNTYLTMSGASMAGAHSGGALALVVSGCPALKWNVDGLFQALQNSADTPPPGNCGAPPDNQGNYTYGYGYLNVLAAVEQCLTGATLHVEDITLTKRQQGGLFQIRASVLIQDQKGAANSGAQVFLDYTLPNGKTRSADRPTGPTGIAIFAGKTTFTGTWTFCVTDVVKEGYAYDPSQNVETCDSLTLP